MNSINRSKAHVELARRNSGLRNIDIALLRTTLSECVSMEDVTGIAQKADILAESLHFNLLLARLLKDRGIHELLPEHRARLQGILKYNGYGNLNLFHAFSKVGLELNRRRIPILLLKGIAFKQMRPGVSRVMYDVDFAVPEDRFSEAVEAAAALGCAIKMEEPHSTDMLMGNYGLDIHRSLTKLGGDARVVNEAVWGRAKPVVAHRVDALLPGIEDMLFLTLDNAIYNLRNPAENPAAVLMWFLDCAGIVKEHPELNWDTVVDNANRTGSPHDFRVLLYLLADIFPALLPDSLVKGLAFSSEGSEQTELRFKIGLLKKKVEAFKRRRILLAPGKFSSPDGFWRWFSISLRYRCLKIVRNSSVLRPMLADYLTRK